MTSLEAISLIEGLDETEDENKLIAAWQYLINTGLVWELQGRFGRTAVHLIESGICTPPKTETEEKCTTT